MLKIIVLLVGLYLIWRFAMSAQLARIQTEIAENTSVTEGAVALMESLSAQIRELKDDPAALDALADQLDANSNKLAAAVAANTDASGDVEDDTDLEPIADEGGAAAGDGTGENDEA